MQCGSENADEHAVTVLSATPRLLLAATLLAPPGWAFGAQASSVRTQPPSEPFAATARDGAIPRRLLTHMDFEESEQFTSGQARGFHRILTHAPVDSVAPTAAGRGQVLPGYPDFGEIAMRRGVGRRAATEGGGDHGWAVAFTVEGASMAYVSDPSLVAVEPGALLVARVWVRSEGLERAHARLSMRFHDASGAPLGAIHSSELRRGELAWEALEIAPPPAPEGARGLALWLELVQPAAARSIDDARFTIAENDVRGSVLFDDLEVWQLPTVGFEPAGSGIVEPGSRARLLVRCSDPAHEAAQVSVRVRDAGDASVHETAFEIPADRTISLEVPPLPTGWYEAEAVYTQGSEQLGRRFARFAVLPEDPFEPDEPPRFGASLESSSMPLEPALDLARAAFVVLPAWTAETDVRDTAHEIARLRPSISRLVDRRVEPMFRLSEVPAALAQQNRIDVDDPFALFALDESRWRPSLEPWLLAFGQEVDQWFIGVDPVDPARGDLPRRIDRLAEAMRTAIAGPAVGVPWSAETPVSSDVSAAVVAGRHVVEAVMEPSVAPEAESASRDAAGVQPAATFEGMPVGPRGLARVVPLPPRSISDRERAIELALRGISAWRAGFDDIAVDVQGDSQPPVPGPPLELAAWRQLSTRLCGRRFVSEIPVAEGVQALLADGARGPVLALWSEAEEAVDVAVDLGSRAVLATDLWGRSARIAPTAHGHALRVGREPLFVEGIEREMCLFRRGFRMDPAFVESRRTQQEAALALSNPWRVPISGTLSIEGPDDLGISPRVHRFALQPGAEARLPVNLSIPRGHSAGSVQVRVSVEGTAEEPFRATMEAPLEIGYRKATVTPAWRLARSIESGRMDLVLSLRVTNVSDESIDVDAFAVADGFMQDQKPIRALAPGATAVRVFHFADGAARLAGGEIRAGVHDVDGDARLLRRIAVPAFDAARGEFADAATGRAE